MGSQRVRHDSTPSISLSCIGEGNGNPLWCSCLENTRDGRAWWAAVSGVVQSWTWLKCLKCLSRNILLRQPEWNETVDDGVKEENTVYSIWGLRCRNRAIFKDSEILYVIWDRKLRWDRLNYHCSQRGLSTVKLEDCEHSSHQRWWWYPSREPSKPSQNMGNNRRPEANSNYQGRKWKKVKSLSHVRLFATPWTVTYQVPLSMGFSRQENWSGLPFPSPGDLPDPGIKPRSPTLQADALTSEPPGKPAWKKGGPKKLFYVMYDEDQWGLLLLPSVPWRRIWTVFL